jgi:amino acid transporter
VATSAGLALASSIYPAAVSAAGASGGRLVWLAIAVAGLFCIMAAANFAELSSMYPTAGGVQVYVRHAFGERPAVAVSLLYVVLAWAAGAAEAFVFASVLKMVTSVVYIPVISVLPVEIWVVLVISFFFFINLRGIETAGRTQDFLTYGMFFLVFALSAYGLVTAAAKGLLLGGGGLAAGAGGVAVASGGISGFVLAVAYSVYLFIGFEWVTPLAEETTDIKVLPRAMPIAVGLLAVSYALWTTAMVTFVPMSELLGHATPHLLFALALAGPAGLLIVGAVSALATFTSFNAGMMGNSRLVYGMAREGVLPKALSKIHMTYFSPWAALTFMFAVQLVLALILSVTGAFAIAILMAAIIECVIYCLVSLVVVKLRKTRPEVERPYRAFGGLAMPIVTAVVFGFLALAVVFPPSPILVGPLFIAALGLCYAYARWAVPWIRERSGRK